MCGKCLHYQCLRQWRFLKFQNTMRNRKTTIEQMQCSQPMWLSSCHLASTTTLNTKHKLVPSGWCVLVKCCVSEVNISEPFCMFGICLRSKESYCRIYVFSFFTDFSLCKYHSTTCLTNRQECLCHPKLRWLRESQTVKLLHKARRWLYSFLI